MLGSLSRVFLSSLIDVPVDGDLFTKILAVTNFDKPDILHEASSKIISTMKGQSADSLVENEKLSIRGN